MDNLRTFFIFGLLIVSLLLWEAWQKDYVRPAQQTAQTEAVQSVSPAMTEQEAADLPDMPSAGEPGATIPDAGVANETTAGQVRVQTDVFDIYIDLNGADIRKLALLQYAVDADQPDVPVQFLNNTNNPFFITQSGLRSETAAPTHYDVYQAESNEYQLVDGQDTLTVPLRWQSESGVTVVKTYTFTRDSYLVTVNYSVENNSNDAFSAYPYAQFNRTRPIDDSMLLYTYTGAVFSSNENEYKKVDFDDLEESAYRSDVSGGWAAMIQHYFVAALLPETDAGQMSFYGKAINNTNYTAGIRLPVLSAAPGARADSEYRMFLGPKETHRLEDAEENLDLTVDYGVLTIISKPLFIVMEWFYKLTGNWGWSIVLLTILIKLVFFKLSATSYRSMASMRKLTPKLTALKERYGDDKQKFNQAMMDLYRTEKINPLGGCLPILVQMPVFLAFYWVLVESVELRQADFILWINDLTAIDPYFVLPVLFGLTMWFQQKLNPMPQDPAQAMMMKIFPLVFTVFFAFFPAGLVLYWLVNNILSIAQQWYITRQMDAL
ncbi:Inner membrane protein translocase component YidC, long form [Methylophaga frappieri]|uniref:Membrane protein insertase YidC n=1 Tax=Methylophaga frappieri (strain ATCC BAA-2434 / DSM 25690 / JAM7) TaxID=754477 RepID=I1YJ96_METFJ|nr:membrane protein insertase YidC [Methylophaga frappieri]AFJ02989.1 Inner membrane protein translocase component YidC, long form [Methylophaga frappieri]